MNYDSLRRNWAAQETYNVYIRYSTSVQPQTDLSNIQLDLKMMV